MPKLNEHLRLTKLSHERVNLSNKRVDFGNKCVNELLPLPTVEHSIISGRNTYSLHSIHIHN